MASYQFTIEARILTSPPHNTISGTTNGQPIFSTEIELQADTTIQADDIALQYANDYVASERVELISVYRKEYIL